MHLEEDNTKFTLFSKAKGPKELRYCTNQKNIIEYFGSQCASKLSGEAMASKVNAKLKFLWRWSRYLTPVFRKLLSKALLQSHFI